jgi:hypothetical protein
MAERFIKTEDLPKSLWCQEKKVMNLPEMLVSQWRTLLEKNNLLETAKKEAPKGFTGGMSEKDTNDHLAWRYNGSCGRVILSILDPMCQLGTIPDIYIRFFAGNKVFLADLPSGSGAAVVSVLTTLAELRKQYIIPRLPLSVTIVAGEISETARDYLRQQLDNLEPILAEQAIKISYEVVEWDVKDANSTTDISKKIILNSQHCDSKLLLLSNFSGFLETEKNWKKSEPQFGELFRHFKDKSSVAIWIEPQKNDVEGFFSRVIKAIIKWFKSLVTPPNYLKAEALVQQPIKDGTFRVNLTVLPLEFPESDK